MSLCSCLHADEFVFIRLECRRILSPAKTFCGAMIAVTPIQITELREWRIVGTESFVTYIMHFTFYFSGRMKIMQMESLICGMTDACCHIEVLIWEDDNLSKCRQTSLWLVFHFVIRAENEISDKMYGISILDLQSHVETCFVFVFFTAGISFIHPSTKICCVCSQLEKLTMYICIN